MDKYHLSYLKWPYDRKRRPFRVRIVEPREYEPESHGGVFQAVVQDLVRPDTRRLDRYSGSTLTERDEFDLVTFPEAFVTTAVLLATLEAVAQLEPTGCFHVGLRPSTATNHLFEHSELTDLVEALKPFCSRIDEDLEQFHAWFEGIKRSDMTNIACCFMVDANGDLRVSLQPKMVRSRFERNALPETNMAESTLLTAIKLVPTGKRLASVVLQPLICSDATNLKTDRPAGGPLRVLNDGAHLLAGDVPDYVDVVSVVTCTPQRNEKQIDESVFWSWHEKFLGSFIAAQDDYYRHHHAVFVLANFQHLGRGEIGGVSGIYLPVTPQQEDVSGVFSVSCYGKPQGDTDDRASLRWSKPDDDALGRWKNKGFIAGLKRSESLNERVRIFRGEIARLPREQSLWDIRDGLSSCTVRVGRNTEGGGIELDWITENG